MQFDQKFSEQSDQFRPHPLIRGGHLQTFASTLIKPPPSKLTPLLHHVDLGDGDQIVLHDDQPTGWQVGDPTKILVHGLGGSHRASYMVRMAERLFDSGNRVFRVDMRGCGAALHLAAHLNHAGRSDDICEAIKTVDQLTTTGPIGVVGVSLGGNQLLKLLGELGAGIRAKSAVTTRITSAVAIAPPIDLIQCSNNMQRWHMKPYNQFFINSLLRNIPQKVQQSDAFQNLNLQRKPKTLFELDDRITAPLSGFSGAFEYYQHSASITRLASNTVPTLVLTSHDDPIVPVASFQAALWHEKTTLEITLGGGHVGYLSTQRHRDWLERRVEKWFQRNP